MKSARLFSVFLLLAAVAVTGCDVKRSSTTTPTPTLEPSAAIPTMLGNWTSSGVAPASASAAAASSGSCSNFVWTVTTQTATDIAGTFTATCLGSANITGNGTGHISGANIAITVTGNGTMPGLDSCPFNITGTGTIAGDTVTVPYTGTTCLGPLSGTQTFSRSLIQVSPVTPSLHNPSDGATVSSLRPTLTVQNVAPRVPGDAMQYAFEVATDTGFANRVATGTVPQTPSVTSYTVPSDLTAGVKYYWHAKTIEAGQSSSFSGTQSFVTPSAAPSPAPPPTGVSDVLSGATVLNSPSNLGGWPVTTNISVLELRPTGVHVEFSAQSSWPDVTPPGWSGSLQYTLGMCLNISSRWYCSAVVEFWRGLDEAGGPPSQYAMNWFYDPARWSPMTGHQPAVGETIGFFVCAGDCRNNVAGDLSPVKERSGVVLVPMPTASGARYTF